MPGVGRKALDERWWILQGALQPDGTLVAATPELGSDEEAVIDALYLYTAPATAVTCALYHGAVEAASFVAESVNVVRDTWEGTIPILGGSCLVLSWSVPNPGSPPAVSCRLHWTRYRTYALPTDPTLANWRG